MFFCPSTRNKNNSLTLIFVCPRNSAGFFYSFYLCRPITTTARHKIHRIQKTGIHPAADHRGPHQALQVLRHSGDQT
ncbi:hypothetical protein ECFDA504_2000, partial [Escherichia coli FDA504]